MSIRRRKKNMFTVEGLWNVKPEIKSFTFPKMGKSRLT